MRAMTDYENLPAREGMRTPHKSRHNAPRFTTRNGRRPSFGPEVAQ